VGLALGETLGAAANALVSRAMSVSSRLEREVRWEKMCRTTGKSVEDSGVGLVMGLVLASSWSRAWTWKGGYMIDPGANQLASFEHHQGNARQGTFADSASCTLSGHVLCSCDRFYSLV